MSEPKWPEEGRSSIMILINRAEQERRAAVLIAHNTRIYEIARSAQWGAKKPTL